MTYWGDILDAEDRLNGDQDFTEPHKNDAEKLLTFKAKHAPNKETSASYGVDLKAAKEGVAFKQKREIKRSEGWYDFKGIWATTNEEWEVNARPEDLNKDGNETTITHTGKFTPNAEGDQWEGSLGVQTGGFEVGPIRPYIGLRFDTNTKQEHKFEINHNFVYEKDVHVGSSSVIDVNNKSLKEAHGIIAWKNQEWGAAWLRSNCLNRYIGLGWSGSIKDHGNHVVEAHYDAGKDAKKGFQGLPLWIRHGAAMKFSNGSSAKVSTVVGENVRVKGSLTLPVQDNLSLTINEKMNVDKWLKGDQAGAEYQFGVGLEFKL